MNESYVTVVGNLTADPVLRTTKGGKPFATFRMASTPRRWDNRERAWVDGGTNFFSVVTFNSLAANVVASLSKGQPAIVHGRLRVNTWSNAEGHSSASVEIDAYHVGHDLTWGQSLFTKPPRAQFDTTDRLAEPEIQYALAEGAGELGDGEDVDPEWAPLPDGLGEQACADEAAVDGVAADEVAAADDSAVFAGGAASGPLWGDPDPERDAYVVAGVR